MKPFQNTKVIKVRKNGRPVVRSKSEALALVKSNFTTVGECLEWNGSRSKLGYGVLAFSGKSHYAHRVAFESANGPIPEGMCVLHKCDNPPCINPLHLFLGTAKENAVDMVKKGRNRNVIFQGSSNGFAKLTERLVSLVRRQRSSGYSYRSIASRFKIPTSTVFYCCKIGWRHV